MPSIDLNCDMGESLLEERIANDEMIMDFVSSVNVACGFHAGNEDVMRRTAAAAIGKGVAVGAHPSFRDFENFGRSEKLVSTTEAFEIVTEQIMLMGMICREAGGRMAHVKPHGALYNQAAKDPELASAIAEAVHVCDAGLILYGLSGSHLISEARKLGLATASEVFSDRTYQPDGSLTPRTRQGALIETADGAIAQVLRMVTENSVLATDGASVAITAETVCIHGDGPHAFEFAESIAQALQENGIRIAAPHGHTTNL
jgi:UPF0271 protein